MDTIETNIEIRAMQHEDLAQISAIEQSVYDEPWPMAAFLASLQLEYPAFVVHQQNTVMGYLLATQVYDEVHILNLTVAPRWQRQGLGARLLACMLQQMLHLGARTFSLEVNVNNQAAIHLYQTHGFKPQGIRKQYYHTANGRADALILVRN